MDITIECESGNPSSALIFIDENELKINSSFFNDLDHQNLFGTIEI